MGTEGVGEGVSPFHSGLGSFSQQPPYHPLPHRPQQTKLPMARQGFAALHSVAGNLSPVFIISTNCCKAPVLVTSIVVVPEGP